LAQDEDLDAEWGMASVLAWGAGALAWVPALVLAFGVA